MRKTVFLLAVFFFGIVDNIIPCDEQGFITPSDGEVWFVDQTHTITWQKPEGFENIGFISVGWKHCPSCLNWIVFGMDVRSLDRVDIDWYLSQHMIWFTGRDFQIEIHASDENHVFIETFLSQTFTVAHELETMLVLMTELPATTILANGNQCLCRWRGSADAAGDCGLVKKDFMFEMANAQVSNLKWIDVQSGDVLAEAEIDENGIAEFFIQSGYSLIMAGETKQYMITGDVFLTDPLNYMVKIIPLIDPRDNLQIPTALTHWLWTFDPKPHVIWSDLFLDPAEPYNSAEWFTGGNMLDLTTVQIFGDPSLPVELSSFMANLTDEGIELKWTTRSENVNRGFEVQRQAFGSEEWKKIGFVSGSGTTVEFHEYSFIDNELGLNGEIRYRLKQVDFGGEFEYLAIVTIIIEAPKEFQLNQNYPNPFNPTTTIEYMVSEPGHISLKVYNSLGQEVVNLVDQNKNAGKYSVRFDASDLSSGTYFYSLQAGECLINRKMQLLK